MVNVVLLCSFSYQCWQSRLCEIWNWLWIQHSVGWWFFLQLS